MLGPRSYGGQKNGMDLKSERAEETIRSGRDYAIGEMF